MFTRSIEREVITGSVPVTGSETQDETALNSQIRLHCQFMLDRLANIFSPNPQDRSVDGLKVRQTLSQLVAARLIEQYYVSIEALRLAQSSYSFSGNPRPDIIASAARESAQKKLGLKAADYFIHCENQATAVIENVFVEGTDIKPHPNQTSPSRQILFEGVLSDHACELVSRLVLDNLNRFMDKADSGQAPQMRQYLKRHVFRCLDRIKRGELSVEAAVGKISTAIEPLLFDPEPVSAKLIPQSSLNNGMARLETAKVFKKFNALDIWSDYLPQAKAAITHLFVHAPDERENQVKQLLEQPFLARVLTSLPREIRNTLPTWEQSRLVVQTAQADIQSFTNATSSFGKRLVESANAAVNSLSESFIPLTRTQEKVMTTARVGSIFLASVSAAGILASCLPQPDGGNPIGYADPDHDLLLSRLTGQNIPDSCNVGLQIGISDTQRGQFNQIWNAAITALDSEHKFTNFDCRVDDTILTAWFIDDDGIYWLVTDSGLEQAKLDDNGQVIPLPPPGIATVENPTQTSPPTQEAQAPTETPVPPTQEAHFNEQDVKDVIPGYIPGQAPGTGGTEGGITYTPDTINTSQLKEQLLVPLTFDGQNLSVVYQGRSAFLPYLEQITSRSTGETLTLSQAASGAGFVGYKSADGNYIEHWLTHVPVPDGAETVVAVVSYNEDDKGTVYAVALDKNGKILETLPIVFSQDEKPTVTTNSDGSVSIQVNGQTLEYNSATAQWEKIEPQILENWQELLTIDGTALSPSNRVGTWRNVPWEGGKLVTWAIGTVYPGVVIADGEISPGVYEISIGFLLNGKYYSYKVMAAECWLTNPYGNPELFEGGGKKAGRRASFTLQGLEQPIDTGLVFEGPYPAACDQVWRGLVIDSSQVEKLKDFFTYGKIAPEWTVDEQGRVDLTRIVVPYANKG